MHPVNASVALNIVAAYTSAADGTWELALACKGDALDRGNYRGLKLTEQSMKVIERIAYSLIIQVVTINWSTFGKPLCR